MRVTRESDYAVRAILEFAKLDGAAITARELADRTQIPEPFLRKILTRLGRGGVIRSSRGRGGGLSLARSPRAISLLDIMEAVQGPLCLNLCLEEPPRCPLVDRCPGRDVWAEVQAKMQEVLSRATIEDLATRQSPCAESLPSRRRAAGAVR